VEDYVVEFQFYSSQCERLSEQQLLGYFIGGLRHGIRSRVCMFKSRDYYVAMQLAREFAAESGHGSRSHYKMGQNSWARDANGSNEIMLNCNKKIVMLTNLNRKMEVTTLMSAFQIEVIAMEDIVNRVVMLLRIVEESAFVF